MGLPHPLEGELGRRRLVLIVDVDDTIEGAMFRAGRFLHEGDREGTSTLVTASYLHAPGYPPDGFDDAEPGLPLVMMSFLRPVDREVAEAHPHDFTLVVDTRHSYAEPSLYRDDGDVDDEPPDELGQADVDAAVAAGLLEEVGDDDDPTGEPIDLR